MFFKNPMFYVCDTFPQVVDLQEAFSSLPMNAATPAAPTRYGFLPLVDMSECWSLSQTGAILFKFGISELKVNSKALNHAIAAGVTTYFEREKEMPDKAAKAIIKEAATEKLLASAPEQVTPVYGFIDTLNKLVVIDSHNETVQETGLALLRSALGTMPAVPLNKLTDLSIGAKLSEWLTEGTIPNSLSCEGDVKLAETDTPRAKASFTSIDPLSYDVTRHISGSMRVKELGLNWSDKLSFKISSDLQVKSVKFDGMLKSQAFDQSEGGALADLDSTLSIQRGTFLELVAAMKQWFELKL